MDNASGHSGDSVQALGKQLRTHIDFSRLMLLIMSSREPRQKIFLETAAECIRLVNAEVDDNKMNWAKKSMVLCGLDVSSNGNWSEEQLNKPLQDIIQRHREAFEKGYEGVSASAQV
ncbi:hypothetical protein PHMEG_00024296 [Phytophthora megakarya]|uniref:Uncharacterized protein n=1 Tax=Phytophthora megakarya TaxID=4795 RepID=A0A225VE26_9STRA|nr:hypothetical protein PHMEG_00024296 [Phytophthora megakarya]